MLQEFSKVKLKSGNIGYITDKLDDVHFYADVAEPTGDISTIFVSLDDIESVLVETEHSLSDFMAKRAV
jgi:hypothetical protein